jgi:hypothetical protein
MLLRRHTNDSIPNIVQQRTLDKRHIHNSSSSNKNPAASYAGDSRDKSAAASQIDLALSYRFRTHLTDHSYHLLICTSTAKKGNHESIVAAILTNSSSLTKR